MLPCPEKYSPLASIRLISSSGKTVRGPRSRHDAMHVEASWYPGCADIQVCRNIPKRPPGLSFSGLRGHAHLRKYHRQLRLSREHFRYCSLAHVFGLVQMNSYKNSRPKKKKYSPSSSHLSPQGALRWVSAGKRTVYLWEVYTAGSRDFASTLNSAVKELCDALGKSLNSLACFFTCLKKKKRLSQEFSNLAAYQNYMGMS